jgi:hypothetical protein
MFGKIFFNAFLLLAIIALQKGFVSSLPYFLTGTNLILISIVFILVVYGFRSAFFWTIGAGSILDIYSFIFFGNYLLSFLLVLLLINFLLVYLFTNKSVYSFLAMVFVAYVFFEIFYLFFYYLEVFLSKNDFNIIFNADFFQQKLFGLATTLFVSLLIFNSLNFLSNKLKPVFLFRN